MCKVKLNNELNGVELFFENKPSTKVLTYLKSNNFRWNGKKSCWYAKQSEKTLLIATELSSKIIDIKQLSKRNVVDTKMDLFELTTFKEVEKNIIHDLKEIAKETRKHIKSRFPYVKFSIRVNGNSIDCNILSSPFEKDSKYLKVIKDYCVKFVKSYNYDNSDTMTDYYDVNFYGGYFDTVYNYKQTEITDDIKIIMEEFDKKEEAAKEIKRIEEEKKYQEYLKKQEEEKRVYELRLKEQEEKKEYINNNIKVVDIEENNQYLIKNAKFSNLNKNNTLDEYKEYVQEGNYYLNDLKVTKEIHFQDNKSLEYFSNMLLHDFDFIKGTGGSYTDDTRINTMQDYLKMTREEQESVQWILMGIAVYYNNELQYVIDAQGHSYARYVGLIDKTIAIIKI